MQKTTTAPITVLSAIPSPKSPITYRQPKESFMKMQFLIFTLMFQFLHAVSAEEKIQCAMSVFEAQGLDPNAAAILTDRLANELSGIPNMACMERSRQQAILNEQGLRDSVCFTNECLLERGRVLGVSYIGRGSISQLGGLITVHLTFFEVASGKLVYSINQDCPNQIEYVASTIMKTLAGQIAWAIGKSLYAGLKIETNPPGAKIFFNGTSVGVSPYQNDKLLSGLYALRMELDTYIPIEQNVTLQKGVMDSVTFNLTHDQAYLDKIEADKKAQALADQARLNKRHKIVTIARITLGTLALGCAGGGYYLDRMVQDNIDTKQEIYDRYRSSSNLQELESSKAEYDDAHKRGETLSLERTLSYVAAGLFAGGFAITFAF
jgi:hypothetical protein